MIVFCSVLGVWVDVLQPIYLIRCECTSVIFTILSRRDNRTFLQVLYDNFPLHIGGNFDRKLIGTKTISGVPYQRRYVLSRSDTLIILLRLYHLILKPRIRSFLGHQRRNKRGPDKGDPLRLTIRYSNGCS